MTAALALLALPVAAAITEGEAVRSTVAIEIGLPVQQDARVAVSGHGDRIRLDLPASARYPADFVAASGGFLAGSSARAREGGRVTLELHLARGVLERVEYAPGGVTLFLASHLEAFGQAAAEEEYRLGHGDRVAVTVHNQPELSSQLTVQEGGTIIAPFVGEVQAGGLTVRQLASRLAELLDRTYLVSPKVDVRVEEYRSQWAVISGEVQKPSRVALRGGTHLKEALSEAGGFAEDAGQEILISRRVNGAVETTTLKIDRAQFEAGAINPVLRHGDIVSVPSARYCYIQGEVRNPSRVRIEPGMTLLRAITIAGGLTEWANRKAVRVLPEGESGPARFYNVKAIQSGRAPDPPMRGGEIVYVRRRSL